jgi:DNA-binding response OmpR family regulator
MDRVLVIAADPDLRRSLQFALEAEGYLVTWRADLSGDDQPGSFDCTVIDHHCVGDDHLRAVAFCRRFRPDTSHPGRHRDTELPYVVPLVV